MPRYEYYCAANRRSIEVEHDSSLRIRNWGELCFASGARLGRTRPSTPVRRIIRAAPAVAVGTSNSELRDAGFTKLVKRDEGVYENVTASGSEARFMRRGKKETMPHLHKKIRD
ncbi:MAG: zinc ribbon domain-containing protein [Gammaproteobacteria bacterium]|nr:zinc ribbon domain-containing protein [Gammaproteobacteria bacterium]